MLNRDMEDIKKSKDEYFKMKSTNKNYTSVYFRLLPEMES